MWRYRKSGASAGFNWRITVAVGRPSLIAPRTERTCAFTHTAPTLDEWRRSAL